MKIITSLLLLCWSISCIGQCVNRQPQPGELGYKARGANTKDSRCEGLIQKNISGMKGYIVSVTNVPLKYQLRDDEEIRVYCPKTTPSDACRITGKTGLKNLYYALDMDVQNGAQKVIPVKEIIKQKTIEAKSYGLMIEWVNKKDTYSPVSIDSKLIPQSKTQDSVYVKYYSMHLIKNVSVTVANPDNKSVLMTKQLKGQWGEDKMIEFVIPRSTLKVNTKKENSYVVTIKGTTAAGEESNISYSFQMVLGNGL